eukprot:CAMPEP_0194375038 /NCGR_PEP_ID=MMETSP0174-20130528/23493_1 /TAXON_ID=216777 /ORGANISM="Proboscia alata, Strain PI-D3" /LENGTH=36 /DNA_ID= /DNA_START= /DNA_END= /DNA_ORIENTATION=
MVESDMKKALEEEVLAALIDEGREEDFEMWKRGKKN